MKSYIFQMAKNKQASAKNGACQLANIKKLNTAALPAANNPG